METAKEIIMLLGAGKIVAIKAVKNSSRRHFPAWVILFADKKTILQLDEQNYYAYHDCSPAARELMVFQDGDLWERYMTEEDWLIDAKNLY